MENLILYHAYTQEGKSCFADITVCLAENDLLDEPILDGDTLHVPFELSEDNLYVSLALELLVSSNFNSIEVRNFANIDNEFGVRSILNQVKAFLDKEPHGFTVVLFVETEEEMAEFKQGLLEVYPPDLVAMPPLDSDSGSDSSEEDDDNVPLLPDLDVWSSPSFRFKSNVLEGGMG